MRVFENGERVNQKLYLDVLTNELKHTQREHCPEGGAVFQNGKEWRDLLKNGSQRKKSVILMTGLTKSIENLGAVVGRVIDQRAYMPK